MGRLLVQKIGNLAGRVMEFVLLVADVLDAGARDVLDAAHIFGQLALIGQADLAADDHAVGGGKGLASHPRFGLLAQKRVENGVGNTVAHLIGMPLGDGFRGEDIVLAAHESAPFKVNPPRQEAVGAVLLLCLCAVSGAVNLYLRWV